MHSLPVLRVTALDKVVFRNIFPNLSPLCVIHLDIDSAQITFTLNP
jgi:hypothetical protein